MSLQEVLTFFRKLLWTIYLFTIPGLYKTDLNILAHYILTKKVNELLILFMETIIKWMGMFLTSE